MGKNKLFVGILAITAAVLSSRNASAELIVNGGFEPAAPLPGGYEELFGGGDTSITGWTTIPTGVEWFNPAIYALSNSPDGGYCVDLANYVYSPGGIEQTFATTSGDTYNVSFYLGTSTFAGRDGTSDITVSAASTINPFSTSTTSADAVWTPEAFTFTANGASTTLSFTWAGNPNVQFAFIDGVSVDDVAATTTTSSVPLPASASTGLVLLCGLVGGQQLNRRRRVSV